jgi:predicted transposase/invertase (TIGR01784 family)
VKLKDQDGDIFYDKLEFIFLQMPLFTKTESELETHQDKWLYFLQNLESFTSLPSIFGEPVFERAIETAEVAALNKDELVQYEMSRMVQWDNYAVMETKINEGIRIGRAEEKTEIARNMKKKGLEPTLIAEMTGLAPEEIERLD